MKEATTHILRTSLKARQYRDIEIESSATLYALAEAVTRSFTFDFDHAFGFYSRMTGRVFDSPIRYERYSDNEPGGPSRDAKRWTVAQAFPRVGSMMLFLYDYGDEWRFKVELTHIRKITPGQIYPIVIAMMGSSPEQYPDSPYE